MYASTKFQLIWRTSDLGNNLPKNINEKNFAKINVKTVIII